jgi:hypothetical protein
VENITGSSLSRNCHLEWSFSSLTIATSEPQHQRSTVSQHHISHSQFGMKEHVVKEAPQLRGIHATLVQ